MAIVGPTTAHHKLWGSLRRAYICVLAYGWDCISFMLAIGIGIMIAHVIRLMVGLSFMAYWCVPCGCLMKRMCWSLWMPDEAHVLDVHG